MIEHQPRTRAWEFADVPRKIWETFTEGGIVPRTRRTAEDAKQVIGAAAVELFVDAGYGATSLDDIAGKVGLTRQAALYHFRTKEDLLRSVVQPYLHDLTTTLDALTADTVNDPPTATEQRATLAALVDALVAHRGVVSLLSRFTTATTIADLGPQLAHLTYRIHTLLAGSALATDPDLRTRAHATTAALIGVISARTEIPLDQPHQRHVLVQSAAAILASAD
jgi:AcrR family transcriptional regulator